MRIPRSDSAVAERSFRRRIRRRVRWRTRLPRSDSAADEASEVDSAADEASEADAAADEASERRFSGGGWRLPRSDSAVRRRGFRCGFSGGPAGDEASERVRQSVRRRGFPGRFGGRRRRVGTPGEEEGPEQHQDGYPRAEVPFGKNPDRGIRGDPGHVSAASPHQPAARKASPAGVKEELLAGAVHGHRLRIGERGPSRSTRSGRQRCCDR